MISRLSISMLATAFLLVASGTARADVDSAWLFKYEDYEQTSHAAPTSPVYNAFYPYVLADVGDFTEPATLVGPTGFLPTTFYAGDDFVTSEHFADAFPSRAALDAAAPNGDYTFTLNGGSLDGQSGSIPLMNPWPEQIPTLTPTSFDTLQSASPGQSIELSWNTFVPAPIAEDARVRVFLLDETDFNFLIVESDLPPNTTSYTIPADMLQAGHDYDFSVLFSNATETTGPAFGSASVLSDVYVGTSVHFTPVPEPTALVLLGVGLTGLVVRAVRQRTSSRGMSTRVAISVCAFACLATAVLLTAAGDVAAQTNLYEVTALGRLETPGRFNFHPANAINNSGVVTGFSWLNTTDDFLFHAWRWDDSGPIVDIGTEFPQGSSGNAVNAAGVIAGNFGVDGTAHIFTHPAGGPVQTYANGNIGPFSAVNAINNGNQIVGQWTAPDESYTAPFLFTEAGGVTVIGNFGDTPTEKTNGSAGDINEAGVIVGWSDRADGTRHAFRHVGTGDLNPALISEGGDDLGTIGTGTLAQANGINEAGVIVGVAEVSLGGNLEPMIWDSVNGMRSLGTLGGNSGIAFEVNESNQVVGYSTAMPGLNEFEDNRAFVWDAANGIRNLNELIPVDAGLTLISAYDINDHGWIVGEAIETATGFRTPYVLTPVPEPSALVLLGVGAVAVLLLGRRRGMRSGSPLLLSVSAAGMFMSVSPTGADAAVTNYRLFKEAYHSQSGPSSVAIDFWAMDANIQAGADDATAIQLNHPAGVLNDSIVDGFWEVFYDFPNRAALDAAYPDGSYTYNISGGSLGNQSGTISMPTDFFPAVAPQLTASSYQSLQNAGGQFPLTIEWNSFVPDPRAANARVRLFLHDHTAETFPVALGNLPATTTSFDIQSGTLIPGHEYDLTLIFSNAIIQENAGFDGTARSLVDANFSTNVPFTAVPEPSSLALLGAGLAGLTVYAVRRRRRDRLVRSCVPVVGIASLAT